MKKLFFLLTATLLLTFVGFAQNADILSDENNNEEIVAEETPADIADNMDFDPDIAREFADEMTAIPSPNDILGIPLWNKDSLL